MSWMYKSVDNYYRSGNKEIRAFFKLIDRERRTLRRAASHFEDASRLGT